MIIYLNIKQQKKTKLIYLNLYGDKASEESAVDLKKKDYQCIAYKDTIITWLKKCKQEVADLPFVRENIKQYILLINKLTGQSRSDKMSNDVVDILMKDEENIKAAFDIHDSIPNLQKRIIYKHLIPALQGIASNNGLDLESFDSNLKYFGFQFVNCDWKYIRIHFQFDKENFRNFYYGFYNNPEKQMPNEIKNKFKNYKYEEGFPLYKYEEGLPLYKYMDVYRDWGKDEFAELAKGQTNEITNEIDSKIKELLKIAEKIGEGL
ncbi:PD-(D/E)XK nuclease family protein [Treponema primitia]